MADLQAPRGLSFRSVRIAVLLSLLLLIAGTIEFRRARIRSWDRVLTVGVYPVLAVDSPEVRAHVGALKVGDLEPVVAFLEREGRRHGLPFSPPLAQVLLGKPIPERPPALPDGAGPLDVIRWSLELRAYSFRVRREHGLPEADVEMFVLFFPAGSPRALDTSVAVERLRIAVVNAEASPEGIPWLQVALAHELLHTAGATDKYGASGQPLAPDGLGDPERRPLYPQDFCELMAGQVATGEQQFREPKGLDECLIGPRTAGEIGWNRAKKRNF
jgi:hypothetical protein